MHDVNEQPKKKSNASTRKSTIGWFRQLSNRLDNHEQMINTFEENYDQTELVDPNLEPINILCMDGGGMKGYGMIKIVEAIQEKCQDKGNFVNQFDLVCGTSVGGILALSINQLDNTEDLMEEAVDVIDECRERTFKNISILNALMTGKAVKSKDSLLQIFEDRYGSEQPLYNPDGVPAFVLCSSRHTNRTNEEGIISEDGHKYEPYILRSYDYPQQEEDNPIYNDFELAKSSNSINLSKAMAATSAVPGLVDRVKVKVDDVNRSFADGFLFANSPVVVALNEARRLYPKRPLGLFMSLGFEQNNFEFATRAISIARLSHPSLLFQRIVPVKAFADFSAQETDIAKIAVMEEKVFDYVRNNIGVNRLLDASIDKLFAPGRTEKRWQVRKSFLKPRLPVSKSADFQRRTYERSFVIPQSKAKSTRLISFKYQDEFIDSVQGEENDGNNQSKSSLCCFWSRSERNEGASRIMDTTRMTDQKNSGGNVSSNINDDNENDNESIKKSVSFAHKKSFQTQEEFPN